MIPALKTQWLGRITYGSGLELQEQLLQEMSFCGSTEHLLLLEHESVYTIGRSRDLGSLGDIKKLPHPVFCTNRGGQATYHGPGQLVCYPLLFLNARGKDLHKYLRFLEKVLIIVLASFGVHALRREGFTGVWVENRKIASIGIGVKQWKSMHGFALNIHATLEEFSLITPCGISGVIMTFLSHEAKRDIEIKEVAEITSRIFTTELEKLPQGQF